MPNSAAGVKALEENPCSMEGWLQSVEVAVPKDVQGLVVGDVGDNGRGIPTE